MSQIPDYIVGQVFTELSRKLVNEHNIACEELTKEQLAKTFAQALACGDFQKYVTQDGKSQAVLYMPYYEEETLRHRIEELEEKLSNAELNLAMEIGQE